MVYPCVETPVTPVEKSSLALLSALRSPSVSYIAICGMSYRIPSTTERQVKLCWRSHKIIWSKLTLVQVRKVFWSQVVDNLEYSRLQIKTNALLGFDITSKIDPKTELSFKLYLHSDGNAVSQSSSVNFEPQMWDPCFKDSKIACYHIDRIMKKTFHQSITMDLDQQMWAFSTDHKIVFDPPLRRLFPADFLLKFKLEKYHRLPLLRSVIAEGSLTQKEASLSGSIHPFALRRLSKNAMYRSICNNSLPSSCGYKARGRAYVWSFYFPVTLIKAEHRPKGDL